MTLIEPSHIPPHTTLIPMKTTVGSLGVLTTIRYLREKKKYIFIITIMREKSTFPLENYFPSHIIRLIANEIWQYSRYSFLQVWLWYVTAGSKNHMRKNNGDGDICFRLLQSGLYHQPSLLSNTNFPTTFCLIYFLLFFFPGFPWSSKLHYDTQTSFFDPKIVKQTYFGGTMSQMLNMSQVTLSKQGKVVSVPKTNAQLVH